MWLRSIWYILTLRCDEADRLRVVARGGQIERHERIAERIHRGLCAGCRRAAKQLDAIDRGLRDLGGERTESDHVAATESIAGLEQEWDTVRRDRLEAALAEARVSDTASGGPAPDPNHGT